MGSRAQTHVPSFSRINAPRLTPTEGALAPRMHAILEYRSVLTVAFANVKYLSPLRAAAASATTQLARRHQHGR